MTQQLIGHEKNRDLLRKLHQEGFAGGSYLFSGMEAVGKKAAARLYAQLVNCPNPAPPCGECLSCRKIVQDTHPDVRMIRRDEEKTVITIDQIRQQVIDESHFKPFEGKYRVFIIDDAHMLNDQAQNALLKTLEEPGDSVIVILVTSRVKELLPTVVSRCREIRFFPLPSSRMDFFLKNIDIPEHRLNLLQAFSGGAPGKALTLASDEDFWTLRSDLLDIFEKLPDGDLAVILDYCEGKKIARTEVHTLETLFEILLSALRDIAFLQNGMDEDALINKDRKENLAGISVCFTPDDLVSLQALILEVRKLVFENNLNIKLALERIFIRIKQAGSLKM